MTENGEVVSTQEDLKQQQVHTVTPAAASSRRPLSASTKLADRKADPELALQEQLQDDRLIKLRAEMSERYIEDLQLPNYGDMWVPGYKLITAPLAKEFGLAGFEDDPFSEMPLDEPQPATGAVDGNIVASFVDGVTGQQKADVLNSCLLAQLHANTKFDRFEEPINWTKYYSRTLENIGWVVPQFTFTRLQSSQTRFSMDTAIISVMAKLMTASEIEVTKATLEALRGLNHGDRRLTIFRRNSVNFNWGDFQLDSIGVSATGTLSMKVTAYGIKTNEQITDVLWFSFSSGSTTLAVAKTTFVLNEQVYDRIRDAVLNKLQDRAINYIGGLDIGS
jgi:hypothetical protein